VASSSATTSVVILPAVLVFIAKVWHLTSFEKGMVTASISVGAMIGAADRVEGGNNRFGPQAEHHGGPGGGP